jgi:FixJ family two-component response regulator
MSNAKEATVYVVDDDASVRKALARLFQSVGLSCETFGDGPAFLARARSELFGCLILDLRLPGPTGLDLQRQLLAVGSDLPIIFISGYADVPTTVRAMQGGAVEFLTKPFEDETLVRSVLAALDIAGRRREERLKLTELQSRFDTLTPREREVMALVVTGKLNKQIAAELGTTEKTIKVHRGQVMHKMKAGSVAALVRMADRLRISSHR